MSRRSLLLPICMRSHRVLRFVSVEYRWIGRMSVCSLRRSLRCARPPDFLFPEEGKRKKSPIGREYAMQRDEVAAFIDRRIQSSLGHPPREQRGARQHQREFRYLPRAAYGATHRGAEDEELMGTVPTQVQVNKSSAGCSCQTCSAYCELTATSQLGARACECADER